MNDSFLTQFNHVKTNCENSYDDSISFYVHVPFCQVRCGYCDFNTYLVKDLERNPIKNWLAAIKTEIKQARQLLGNKKVTTIFFGGGTPSYVGAEMLVEILSAIKENFALSPEVEITSECNPESVDYAFFQALRQAGFNRISMGMQSAQERLLKILDRVHTPGRAFEAVTEAREAGFQNINLDVIFGTPTETEAELKDTLQQVVSSGVDHVSAYSLIVEPGTAMARKVRQHIYEPNTEDELATKYLLVEKYLAENGFAWYEISNWAKTGDDKKICQHNLAYWNNHNWWGLGPGAHSHFNDLRWWNWKLPHKYGASLAENILPIDDWEVLTTEQKLLETVMLNIRTKWGLPVTGLSKSVIDDLISEGLLVQKNNNIVLTLQGRLLGDLVARRLVEV